MLRLILYRFGRLVDVRSDYIPLVETLVLEISNKFKLSKFWELITTTVESSILVDARLNVLSYLIKALPKKDV